MDVLICAVDLDSPEKCLWWAVLADAAHDVRKDPQYFWSKDFEEVCSYVGVEPDYFRKVLRQSGLLEG